MELTFDPAWVSGLLLATVRATTFVLAGPFPGRLLLGPARTLFAVALALLATAPVRLPDDPETVVAAFGAAVFVNAAVGAALGFAVGMVVHLFAVAGGVLDFTGAFYAAQLFDPMAGEQVGPFARLLTAAGIVALIAAGALAVPVVLFTGSFSLVGLTGQIPAGFAGHLSETAALALSELVIAGVQLALPAVVVLLLIELTFGLAARLAPQANMLLLGLPVKLLVVFSAAAAVMVSFPEVVANAALFMESAAEELLEGLR